MGDNKEIVMIHGMMFGGWYWENYKNFFEDRGFSCFVPTLPFHDMNPQESPAPELGTTSLLDYADYLESEIKKLGSTPIIMGHSMGGLLTQILAGRGLAKAAVLITPASPGGINALAPSTIISFADVILSWKFWERPFRFSFRKAVYSMLHKLPEDKQKDVYNRMVFESGYAAFQIGFWPLDSMKAAQVDNQKVTCPVLVVSGKEDRITPARASKKVAKKYQPVSTYKEFENHAHFLLMEPGWEKVSEYVYNWLAGKLSGVGF